MNISYRSSTLLLNGCSRKYVNVHRVSNTQRQPIFGPNHHGHRLHTVRCHSSPSPSSKNAQKLQDITDGASTNDIDNSMDDVEIEIKPGVFQGWWRWRGFRVRYQRSGNVGQSILCVHGFGGNADHWRNNLPILGKQNCRVYAVDLLGYGFSSKPDPRVLPVNSIYNFNTWSQQIRDFIKFKIRSPTLVTCNSVGGIAGLQAAVDEPLLIPSLQIINVSLRMLHHSKQPALLRPFVTTLQNVLRTTPLGPMFFNQIATRQGVKNVLQQCYCDKTAVTDELVDVILKPGLEPGAVDVFLDFISYSGGPLPEELLKEVSVPVSVVWGANDPWEKVEWGREFAKYPSVEEFIELPGVGHCPQCESPDQVNRLILEWAGRHRLMDE